MPKLPFSPVLTPPSVFFDDSGCNEQWSSHFVWAGYWATYYFWRLFGDEWNAILDRSPALPYWHQADVRDKNRTSKRTPFQGLTEAQLTSRESSLCDLIRDNLDRMHPLVIQVPHAEIREHVSNRIMRSRALTRDERRLFRPDVLERPNFIALFYAAKIVAEAQERNASDVCMPVSLHCEDRKDDPYQDHMLTMWRRVSLEDRQRMGTLSFPPGKTRDTPQLQAADMLAWHVNQRSRSAYAADDPMWAAVGGPSAAQFAIPTSHLQEHVAYWNSFDPSGYRNE